MSCMLGVLLRPSSLATGVPCRRRDKGASI